MNDRIIEMAIEAGFNPVNCTGGNVPLFNKFAELIIRECVQTLHNNTPVFDENESLEDWNKGYIRAMLDCEHHITEHFGVE